MMRILVVFISLLTFNCNIVGQKSDKILKEGKLLYPLEKTSGYSTDDTLDTFGQIDNIIPQQDILLLQKEINSLIKKAKFKIDSRNLSMFSIYYMNHPGSNILTNINNNELISNIEPIYINKSHLFRKYKLLCADTYIYNKENLHPIAHSDSHYIFPNRGHYSTDDIIISWYTKLKQHENNSLIIHLAVNGFTPLVYFLELTSDNIRYFELSGNCVQEMSKDEFKEVYKSMRLPLLID